MGLGGIKQYTFNYGNFEGFPFYNALFWLGNIIMTSNKVSSVHG